MKALFLLIAAPLLAQVTPDCTYTLKSAPGGSIIVHRNGVALEESDYTRTGSGGLRTITLNGWNDGDQMIYYYSAGASINVPGTTPPSHITIYLPTKEYRTCVGTQTPPPPPPFPPANVPGPTKIGLSFGPAPTDTLVNGQLADGVLYADQADFRLHLRLKEPQPPMDVTADERQTIDCANSVNCTAGVPATTFTLLHQPKSLGCVWVYRNGIKLYSENGQWSLAGQILTIPVTADKDYIEIRYIWTNPTP